MPAAAERPAPARAAWRKLPDWRLLPPPDPRLEFSIVMPVLDEAEGLPATLAALARQVDAEGRRLAPSRYEVIVLANNCRDASAEVVRRFAARRPSMRLHVVEVRFPKPVAHVGHARRVLMDEACRRLEASPIGARGVIASTDGDTRVAPDWLAATLAEMARGADAVGGRIELDGCMAADGGLATLARRDDTYQRLRSRLEHVLDPDPHDPWPRHHQHFGASLALTADAYRRAGGLPAERFLEDEALYQALRLHDLRVRHSGRVKVVTSSRREGRVEVGLSWQLREWSTLAHAGARRDPQVVDPRHEAGEWSAKRRLREGWLASRAPGVAPAQARAVLRETAEALSVGSGWLAGEMRTHPTFGALWRSVQAHRHHGRPAPGGVPMRAAIATLRELVAERRTGGEGGPSARAGADPGRPLQSTIGAAARSKRSSR